MKLFIFCITLPLHNECKTLSTYYKIRKTPFSKRRLFIVENLLINKTNYLINESQLERVNSSFSYMYMLNIYPYQKYIKYYLL